MPLASIVIPTLGRPHLLARALDSVRRQTIDEWEAIVVDEGGLEETRAVVASFGDDRIIFHRQPGRVGIVENWGTGVRMARSDFVAILADDDLLRPRFLERRIVSLRPRPDLLVAFSRFEVQRPDGSLEGIVGDWDEETELDGDGLLVAALGRRWFVGASLYRRERIVELWPRLRDDGLVVDMGLDLRLALAPGARGVALPSADFVMLSHPQQSSVALLDEVRTEANETLARVARELGRDHRAQLVQDERARWLTTWARAEIAAGHRRAAFPLLVRAVAASPLLASPWRQLVLAAIKPRRRRDGRGR